MLEPVSKERVFEIVAKEILKYIRNKDLSVGTKLPTERELSEQLQVSRSSVREALRVLEVLGFVQQRSGEGTFICEPLNNTVLSHFYTDFYDLKWYQELIEARKIIETKMTVLAAARRTQEHLNDLEDCLKDMYEKINKGIRPVKENARFHQIIWNASENRFLAEIATTIFTLIFKKESVLGYEEKISSNFYQDHKDIFLAILAKDEVEAKKAMKKHHESIENMVINSLNERTESE